MHRINAYISSAVLAMGAVGAAAQVHVDHPRHEFGTVLWNSPSQATFTLRNDSRDTLHILQVRPDCGCTAATWTTHGIAPGAEGTVSATYDAALLGRFEKQLAVYTNLSATPLRLTLSGDVAQELNAHPNNFSYHVGDIYLEADNVEFDDVRRGDMPVKTIRVYNAGKKSATVSLMHLPKYLTATIEPESIRPGRSGRLHLTLNSEQLRTYGLTQTSVYVSRFAGDRVNRDNEISISATLLPEQSYTDAELAVAPQAVIDSTTVDMGSFGNKKRLKTQLTLTNAGDSPLKISALQVYNPGISVSLGKRTLAAGQSDKLTITVSATTHDFKGRRRILLITNDPVHPKMIIDVVVKK